jgi:hypothetical protein
MEHFDGRIAISPTNPFTYNILLKRQLKQFGGFTQGCYRGEISTMPGTEYCDACQRKR